MHIGQLFNRSMISCMLLVSVKSEVTIVIIFILITESAPGSISVLVSSSNRSSILYNLLEYAVMKTWFAWLNLVSQCF